MSKSVSLWLFELSWNSPLTWNMMVITFWSRWFSFPGRMYKEQIRWTWNGAQQIKKQAQTAPKIVINVWLCFEPIYLKWTSHLAFLSPHCVTVLVWSVVVGPHWIFLALVPVSDELCSRWSCTIPTWVQVEWWKRSRMSSWSESPELWDCRSQVSKIPCPGSPVVPLLGVTGAIGFRSARWLACLSSWSGTLEKRSRMRKSRLQW